MDNDKRLNNLLAYCSDILLMIGGLVLYSKGIVENDFYYNTLSNCLFFSGFSRLLYDSRIPVKLLSKYGKK